MLDAESDRERFSWRRRRGLGGSGPSDLRGAINIDDLASDLTAMAVKIRWLVVAPNKVKNLLRSQDIVDD